MTDRISSELKSSTGGASAFTSGISASETQNARLPRTWWINLLLFVLTLFSTTLFGAALSDSFARGQGLDEHGLAKAYTWLVHFDSQLIPGLAYSLPLLAILLAHEFGHYFKCLQWNVQATLPYFGPSPTLLGTVGAFIWIRSPIYNRRSLFDIGVWGPICGFALLLPFLFAGILLSRVCPGVSERSLITFGTPLIMTLMERWRFPGIPSSDICLHPMAVASWAGLLATSVNLLPVGQLDGGHILYGLLGRRWHKVVSSLTIGALMAAAFFYWPWGVWAIALFFLRRHPSIYDDRPLDNGRRAIGIVAAILFGLSFAPVPIRVG